MAETSRVETERAVCFKQSLRVVRRGEVVFLLGERQRFVLEGGVVSALAQLLERGPATIGELLQITDGRVDGLELLGTLERLMDQALVVEADDAPPAETAFWAAAGLSASRSEPRATAHISAAQRLAPLAEVMSDALGQARVECDPDGSIHVVVTDDYLAPEVPALVDIALSRGRQCFLIKPTGISAWIGPLLEPRRGPCPECLLTAVRAQRPVEVLLADKGEMVLPPAAALEASVRAACSLAAVNLKALLNGGPSLPADSRELVTLDFAGLETRSHSLHRRPQCPRCGDAGLMSRQAHVPIALQQRAKPFSKDGGFRCQAPAETVERLQRWVSPVLGPITHLAPMPRRHTARRPVFSSGYMGRPRDSVPTRNVFDRICAGKGRSLDQARASALCEAVERYSGLYQGDEARLTGSLESLGKEAITPNQIQLFSERQLASARAERGGAQRAAGERIPRPSDEKTVLDFTPAWSLTYAQRRWVPLALCYSDAPRASGTDYCVPSSNGSAAGNCLEEAVLQGLLELIERDAVALWWYNRSPRPGLGLATVANDYLVELEQEYGGLGWDTWALDLTHDLGVPVIAAVACERASERFAFGFGCHLDLDLAVQRAFTELNQVFDPEPRWRGPCDHLEASKLKFLRPALPSPGRSPGLSGAWQTPNLKADIDACTSRLAARGLEVLVVDKTRPDLPLHVVQVIVPGLRHIWPRLAPGRLYDVPSALGWRERPLTESELNPVPLLI